MQEEADFARAVRRVRTWTRAILLAGAVAAVVIFFVNGTPREADFELGRSKQYLHDMEVYGGRANVLAADFREWFAGLWHGRTLAGTVAVLTVLAALLYRFIATPMPLDEERNPPEAGPPA